MFSLNLGTTLNTIVSKTTVNKILLFSLTVPLLFFVANIILKTTRASNTGLFLFLP